jgi:glycyl-tRNA synthetase
MSVDICIFGTKPQLITMNNLYDSNGLIFWSEKEIELRNIFEKYFVSGIKHNLKMQNRAFDFHKCEAPLLTPDDLINPNYTEDDVWMQDVSAYSKSLFDYVERENGIENDRERLDQLSKEHMVGNGYYDQMLTLRDQVKNTSDENPINGQLLNMMIIVYKELYPQKRLVLRPETTMGSYAYARHLLNPHNETKVMPPLVVYQHGKSFRREQDQPTKFMRLKEFYQLEFQILYSPSTKNDYSVTLIPAVRDMISEMIGPCHMEDSDRLPDYAEWTKDIICTKSGMEVCSISKRKDYEGMNVIEVAIGTDRCIFNFQQK